MDRETTLDVVTLGRCSVDLYGQQVGGRLEDMGSFAKYVGGCPCNIAIGSSRLGLRAGFVSRVGDEHLGRFIRETLVVEGVDVSCLKTDPDRLTALAILGIRDEHTFPLIFYRENCADMAVCEDDVDPAYAQSAKAVVITGTHLSTPTVAAASRKLAEAARDGGRRVVFDIDYRPVLWNLTGAGLGEERFVASSEVTERLRPVLPLCDLIVGTEEEFHIAGGTTDTLAAIRNVRAATAATIVCKRGPMGCVVFDGAIPDDLEEGIQGPGFPVEVYNVLGAGDAFMSGFLRGWLRDLPLQECCRLANACGAFAVSRHGCAPAVPSWTELTHLLEHGSATPALRKDAVLNRIHWGTTRRRQWPHLFALAFDHRAQFEAMASEAGLTKAGPALERIGAFKRLAYQAACRVADGRDGFGILVDDRLGRDALHAASDGALWIGRPIEVPGSRPVDFEEGPDLGSALAEWPVVQTVKCLVFYHPDDPEDLRDEQERRVARLFDACRRTGHEMMLEVIAGKHGPLEADTAARAMQKFYAIGVAPDWWKLEPAPDPAAWREVSAVIRDRDPHCQGVVMLGLDAPEEDLIRSFDAAAREPVMKGFAVGRSIFGDVAREWFADTVDDAGAVSRMSERFDRLVAAWTAAASGRAA